MTLNWLKYSKLFVLTLILLSTALWAEISIGIGHTSGRYKQTISEDTTGRRSLHQNVLPGRISLWYELDSRDHHLFLDNDQVIYGLGLVNQAHYKDYTLDTDRIFIIPLYTTYYLNYGDFGVGGGINLALMDIRTPRNTTTLAQQLGKQLALRYNRSDWYIEAMVMQNCAANTVDAGESFYDITQYILRYGWYLENN